MDELTDKDLKDMFRRILAMLCEHVREYEKSLFALLDFFDHCDHSDRVIIQLSECREFLPGCSCPNFISPEFGQLFWNETDKAIQLVIERSSSQMEEVVDGCLTDKLIWCVNPRVASATRGLRTHVIEIHQLLRTIMPINVEMQLRDDLQRHNDWTEPVDSAVDELVEPIDSEDVSEDDSEDDSPYGAAARRAEDLADAASFRTKLWRHK